MVPPPPPPSPDDPERRQVDIGILQYQVGSLQTALDRGIGALERTIDKGFADMGDRMASFEKELRLIQERQAFDAARLKALEQFRDAAEQEVRQQRAILESNLQSAQDNSQMWKVARWLCGVVLAVVTLAAMIAGIVSAL